MSHVLVHRKYSFSGTSRMALRDTRLVLLHLFVKHANYAKNLQEALEKLFQWFSANYLEANAGKCHLQLVLKQQ